VKPDCLRVLKPLVIFLWSNFGVCLLRLPEASDFAVCTTIIILCLAVLIPTSDVVYFLGCLEMPVGLAWLESFTALKCL